MTLLENLFGFDDRETPGERLFFRVFEGFVVVSAAWVAWHWAAYMDRISDVVLPLGIARYVDVSFLFGGVAGYANAAVIGVLLLMGLLRWSRWAYLLAFALLHLQFSARYTLGEIPHSANLLGMALLGLGLATALFRPARHVRRFTLGCAYFFIGLGYTSAAVCKLVGTGPHWVDGRHLWMWLNEKSIDLTARHGVFDFNAVQELLLSSQALATLFLTIGLVSEACAFLCWWRRFRMPVLSAVLALHVGIYLVMGIIFKLSMVELVLLAFPWAAWADRALAHAPRAWQVRIRWWARDRVAPARVPLPRRQPAAASRTATS